MIEEQNNNSVQDENGNSSKPLLADVLKLSRYSLLNAFNDNGLRVYEIYYTMSKTRLAEKLIEELHNKNKLI